MQKTWFARATGDATVEIPDCSSGREAAERYVDGGQWGDPDDLTSSWVEVWVWTEDPDDPDGEPSDEACHYVPLHPDEPPCDDEHEHDWVLRDEQLSGGGAIIEWACTQCGCRHLKDSWARDPESGREGLTSHSYEPRFYREIGESA
jgi:hypothetical protein